MLVRCFEKMLCNNKPLTKLSKCEIEQFKCCEQLIPLHDHCSFIGYDLKFLFEEKWCIHQNNMKYCCTFSPVRTRLPSFCGAVAWCSAGPKLKFSELVFMSVKWFIFVRWFHVKWFYGKWYACVWSDFHFRAVIVTWCDFLASKWFWCEVVFLSCQVIFMSIRFLQRFGCVSQLFIVAESTLKILYFSQSSACSRWMLSVYCHILF